MTGISDKATEENVKLEAATATLSEQTPAHEANHADGSESKETEHQGASEEAGEKEKGAKEENIKHRQLRARLERAVQSKDVAELEPAVEAVKKEKVPNCSELLDRVWY